MKMRQLNRIKRGDIRGRDTAHLAHRWKCASQCCVAFIHAIQCLCEFLYLVDGFIFHRLIFVFVQITSENRPIEKSMNISSAMTNSWASSFRDPQYFTPANNTKITQSISLTCILPNPSIVQRADPIDFPNYLSMFRLHWSHSIFVPFFPFV